MPDTLTVKRESASSTDSGGGRVKGTAANAHSSVPCVYEPIPSRRDKPIAGQKLITTQRYKVTMPTHQSGSRINLDPQTDRLVIAARVNEPVKTMRIISIGDVSGVVFEVVCEREG